MGSLSIWHYIILLLMLANMAAFLHIALTNTAAKGAKLAWLIAAMFFPFIAYLLWLTVGKKGGG